MCYFLYEVLQWYIKLVHLTTSWMCVQNNLRVQTLYIKVLLGCTICYQYFELSWPNHPSFGCSYCVTDYDSNISILPKCICEYYIINWRYLINLQTSKVVDFLLHLTHYLITTRSLNPLNSYETQNSPLEEMDFLIYELGGHA